LKINRQKRREMGLCGCEGEERMERKRGKRRRGFGSPNPRKPKTVRAAARGQTTKITVPKKKGGKWGRKIAGKGKQKL
jgi:hypothetical protein